MPISNILCWLFHEVTGIDWLELIKTLAPVVTAFIAFSALRNWQRQDKAKREAEFLHSLIEAPHAYITEMHKPIQLLEYAKIGIASHAPTWESGSETDKAVKGAINYITKAGERDARRLLDVLQAIQPLANKLRSLIAMGQVFNFDGYAKCYNAVQLLTWHFDRIEGFTAVISSPTLNWENPIVQKSLNDVMAIDPEDIRKGLKENNVVVLEFVMRAYRHIYG